MRKLHWISNLEELKKNTPKRVLEEVEEIKKSYEVYLLNVIQNCESPIEKLFAVRLFNRWDYQQSLFQEITPGTRIEISSQQEIDYRGKKYRTDFTIYVNLPDKEYKFVIECDGHEFHEKTKAQAAKDKARDRDLQSLGFRVIRFTGSEIWENPNKCASETFDIIYTTTGLEEEHSKQLGLDMLDH